MKNNMENTDDITAGLDINKKQQNAMAESKRLMTICNACRYCEGLCPVFPEMTRYKTFDDSSIHYLANLCHNCKGCYYGCQYAEPHNFDVNVPKVFSQIRGETFVSNTFPKYFAIAFEKGGTVLALLTALSITAMFLLALLLGGNGIFFTAQQGEGSFFAVIPLAMMSGIPSLLTLFATVVIIISYVRFTLQIKENPLKLLHPANILRASVDVLTLRHLGGGKDAPGCTHVNEKRSRARRWFHQFTFYGFMLCFASTSVAAVYHHFLGWVAPYAYTSVPVLLGTVGGLGLLIGPVGLTIIKLKVDARPVYKQLASLEYIFISQLFFISATGLLLMLCRDTAYMASLLCVHLGFVFAFFAVMPYSKFMHAIYRSAALLKYAKRDERQKNSIK